MTYKGHRRHACKACNTPRSTAGDYCETCINKRLADRAMPAPAPIDALLTALDQVSWILENWQDAYADVSDEDDTSDTFTAISALWAAAAAIRGTVN